MEAYWLEREQNAKTVNAVRLTHLLELRAYVFDS